MTKGGSAFMLASLEEGDGQVLNEGCSLHCHFQETMRGEKEYKRFVKHFSTNVLRQLTQ